MYWGKKSCFWLFRASQYATPSKTAQIFELNRLEEQLAAAHLCSNAHFIFIADVNSPQGLYHENGLKFSACKKVSPFTNFEPKPLHQCQEPNQRLYVSSALTGIHHRADSTCLVLILIYFKTFMDILLIIGAGYECINLVMSILCLKIPQKSNFVPQVLHM